MRKIFVITTILLFFLIASVKAQITVTSFEKLTTGEALTKNKNDGNGQICALIKIYTTGLDDIQRKRLQFNTDAVSRIAEVQYPTGAVWIFISPEADFLEIAHPDLGVRRYDFRIKIESKRDYEMKIANATIRTIVEEVRTSHYLSLKVSPPESNVMIDDEVVLLESGNISRLLPVGKHRYSISCPLYYPESGTFDITPDKKTELSVSLRPNCGYIQIESAPESGATVFIDGKNVGTTPFTSERLESKLYNIQVVKTMFEATKQVVEVKDDQTTSVKFTLNPNFAEPTFTTAPDAEIWINDERKGVGRWSDRLSAGVYRVSTHKVGHRAVKREYTMNSGTQENIVLDAPEPMYGSLDISSSPAGADIVIDGTKVGTTPDVIGKLLVGSKSIRLEKSGYVSTNETVQIEEGKTAALSLTLPTGRELSIICDNDGDLYLDGAFLVKGNYTGTVAFGNHTVELRKGDKVEDTQTIEVTTSATLPIIRLTSAPPSFTINGTTFEMIKVEGGTFLMGSNDNNSTNNLAHSVTLSPYYIGKTEVTQALWKAVMGSNPSLIKGDHLPVEHVSWDDCQTFISKLNLLTEKRFSLPTEAQWEFAARGGNKSKGYLYAGSNHLDDVAWYKENCRNTTHSVGGKQPNELGIYDMNGNVWEWCQDWYGTYNSDSQTDPSGPDSGSFRVARGASWANYTSLFPCTYRSKSSPEESDCNLGFRIVLLAP